MKFRLGFKGTNVQEVEADEQAIEGDWLILNKYVKGRGLVTVFRVRHADIYSLEVDSGSLGQENGGVSDPSAIGRVWGLISARDGVSEEVAATTVPGPAKAPSSQEVRRTYRELGVEPGQRVDEAAKKAAAERLDDDGLLTDAAAIGRVWGLRMALEGKGEDEAVHDVPGAHDASVQEVRRTYQALGIKQGTPVSEEVKKAAGERLGKWPA
jgi:hypothetical protein